MVRRQRRKRADNFLTEAASFRWATMWCMSNMALAGLRAQTIDVDGNRDCLSMTTRN